MARLPGSEALGERPAPALPRRTPMVAEYRPTTGFEDAGAQSMAHTSAEFQQAAAVVLTAKDQQDTLAAEDAYNKLRLKQVDLTYGPNGIMSLKGSQTMNRDLPAEYGGQLSAAATELSGGLGNDYQRQLFAKRAAHAEFDIKSSAAQHQAQQSDVYANQVLQGTLDTESRVAAAGGDLPTSMLRITSAIDRHAQRFGTPEQEVTALKMKAADSLWSSKIKSLVYTDPTAAQRLFSDPAINAQIGPANRIVLEHELHTAIRPIEAKGIAEQAMAPQAVQLAGAKMEAGGEPTLTPVVNQQEGVRTSAALPSTTRDLRAQLGSFVTRGEELAEHLHPGDAVFRDQVIAQIKGKVSTIAAAFEGEQRQAHGMLLTQLSGGPDGKRPKPTTLDELFARPGAREAYTKLDPGSLQGISAALQHNQIESMGRPVKTNPKVEKALYDRIYLSDDDPRKINSPAQLTQYFASGLNQGSIDWLTKKIDEQLSAGGRNFSSDIKTAIDSAHRRFVTSPIGSIQPDKAEDASYKFRYDLTQKIDEYRKAGKDPRGLITPGSSDFMLTSERLATYMPGARQAVSDAASSAYEAGKTYEFKQGRLKFKGGDPKAQINWEPAK